MKKGWEMKNLGDVCSVLNGGTPDTTIKEFWDGENLWITPKDMGKLNSIYVDDTERKITDAGLKNSSAKILPVNSVVLSSRAPIGHLAINTKPISTNQGCKGIIPTEKINTHFLFYFLKKSVQLLNDLGSGTTFKELSGSKLSDVKIPLPPISEQQHIVSILSEAFAGIEQAKENLQCNLQNAKDLFQSEKNQVFKNLAKTEGKVPIASVCNEIFAGGDAPKENFSDEKTEKYPIPIFANAVGRKGLYGFTDVSRVTEPSITIAGRGSGTGYTEVRYEPFFPIVRLIVLTPNIEKITLEFLKYAIQSLTILKSGSAIPQLTIPMIKGYSLPLPSLKEQKKIVYQFDTLEVQTKNLENIYQQKLNALEELKKSILHKAFSGELTKTQTEVSA